MAKGETSKRAKLVRQIKEILKTEIPLGATALKIEKLLKQDIQVGDLAARIEEVINKEIPHTPRISGRRRKARVLYVALPGRGKAKTQLTARTLQVWEYLQAHQHQSAIAMQANLQVNRNVIAGAIHELKKAGLVKVEPNLG